MPKIVSNWTQIVPFVRGLELLGGCFHNPAIWEGPDVLDDFCRNTIVAQNGRLEESVVTIFEVGTFGKNDALFAAVAYYKQKTILLSFLLSGEATALPSALSYAAFTQRDVPSFTAVGTRDLARRESWLTAPNGSRFLLWRRYEDFPIYLAVKYDQTTALLSSTGVSAPIESFTKILRLENRDGGFDRLWRRHKTRFRAYIGAISCLCVLQKRIMGCKIRSRLPRDCPVLDLVTLPPRELLTPLQPQKTDRNGDTERRRGMRKRDTVDTVDTADQKKPLVLAVDPHQT